jgi:hypothetical protein
MRDDIYNIIASAPSGEYSSGDELNINFLSNDIGTFIINSGIGTPFNINDIEFFEGSSSSSSSSSSYSLSSSSYSSSSSSSSSSSTVQLECEGIISFGERPTDTFQNVTQDIYIDGLLPDINYGTSPVLKVKRGMSQGLQNSLIKFDLSALRTSPDLVVRSAILHLYTTENINEISNELIPEFSSGLVVGVYRLLEDWSAGAGDGIPTEIGEADYNFRIKDADERIYYWRIHGALMHRYVYDASIYDSTAGNIVTITQPNQYYSWDVTDAVQYFHDHEDKDYGFLLTYPRSNGNYIFGNVEFVSSENAQVNTRPYLVVEFERTGYFEIRASMNPQYWDITWGSYSIIPDLFLSEEISSSSSSSYSSSSSSSSSYSSSSSSSSSRSSSSSYSSSSSSSSSSYSSNSSSSSSSESAINYTSRPYPIEVLESATMSNYEILSGSFIYAFRLVTYDDGLNENVEMTGYEITAGSFRQTLITYDDGLNENVEMTGYEITAGSFRLALITYSDGLNENVEMTGYEITGGTHAN